MLPSSTGLGTEHAFLCARGARAWAGARRRLAAPAANRRPNLRCGGRPQQELTVIRPECRVHARLSHKGIATVAAHNRVFHRRRVRASRGHRAPCWTDSISRQSEPLLPTDNEKRRGGVCATASREGSTQSKWRPAVAYARNTSRQSVAGSGCSTELVQPPRSSGGTKARTPRSAASCNSDAICCAASEDSAEKRTSTETCSVGASSSGCSSSSRIACTRGSSERAARTPDRIASGDSPSSGIDSVLV
jgi:hypothetical protein